MLNSEDLAQLKIQALTKREDAIEAIKFYPDITAVFSSASCEHVVIKDSQNSNIVSFCYVLLSQIYDNKIAASPINSSQGSPQSQQNSGSASVNPDQMLFSNQSSKFKEKDENAQIKKKMSKIYTYLLMPSINFSEVFNLPINIQKILQQHQIKNKQKKNLYLKRLFVQFLRILREGTLQPGRPNSKTGENGEKKQSIVFSSIQKYSISEALLSIFIRSILFSEYEIIEALDFRKQISDHTVYAALCDAFHYGSLHMQQSHTQISYGCFIRNIRLKNKDQKCNNTVTKFYLVTLPFSKSESTPSKQQIQSDTFRIRRKSSDHTSNNQSVSFRQGSRPMIQDENKFKVSSLPNYSNRLYNTSQSKKQQDRQLNKPKLQQPKIDYKTQQQNKIIKNKQQIVTKQFSTKNSQTMTSISPPSQLISVSLSELPQQSKISKQKQKQKQKYRQESREGYGTNPQENGQVASQYRYSLPINSSISKDSEITNMKQISSQKFLINTASGVSSPTNYTFNSMKRLQKSSSQQTITSLIKHIPTVPMNNNNNIDNNIYKIQPTPVNMGPVTQQNTQMLKNSGGKQWQVRFEYGLKQKQKQKQKQKPHNTIRQSGLNGYTSIQILRQLSPKVRESMVNNINHFRKIKL